jgi:hypothetical protein
MSKEQKQSVRLTNMAFAVAASQAGCFSLVIVLIALFVGIWLDSQFQVKGPFTIGVLIVSVPISLFVMVRIALGSVKNIAPPPPKKNSQSNRSTYSEEEDF